MDNTGTGATAAEADNRAFEVEQHGIDHIADSQRRGGPFELFWIWLGANVMPTFASSHGMALATSMAGQDGTP